MQGALATALPFALGGLPLNVHGFSLMSSAGAGLGSLVHAVWLGGTVIVRAIRLRN